MAKYHFSFFFQRRITKFKNVNLYYFISQGLFMYFRTRFFRHSWVSVYFGINIIAVSYNCFIPLQSFDKIYWFFLMIIIKLFVVFRTGIGVDLLQTNFSFISLEFSQCFGQILFNFNFNFEKNFNDLCFLLVVNFVKYC